MNTLKDRESTVAAWLDDGPLTLPPDTRQAIAVGIRTVPQRSSGIGWPLRVGLPSMNLRRLSVGFGGTAAVILAAVVALNVFPNLTGLGGLSPDDPRRPFVGVWISTTDSDHGTQTMRVRAEGIGLHIVVTDTIATVCKLTPSTMTATGRVDNGIYLVMPAPTYRCDDGTEPLSGGGPPLNEILQDFTLVRDAQADLLTDSVGAVWLREGAPRPSSTPGPDHSISDSMWPQTSLEEVRLAQELADAEDPAYSWQVAPELLGDEWSAYLREPGTEIVDRFLHEELGWDKFLFNPYVGDDGDGILDGILGGIVYLRCGPSDTNPMYPVAPEGHQESSGAERCAPTLDEFRYESVSLDLMQPGQKGATGIWVVSRSAMTTPFAQEDPRIAEANALDLLNEFLQARLAGEGAEGQVRVDSDADVPLLYTTTSGASYERYEIERVEGPHWPNARMTFSARLFADDDATVVEQKVRWEQSGVLSLDANATTENGQPVVLSHTSSDGEMTVSAPSTWETWLPGKGAGNGGNEQALDVWFGGVWRPDDYFGSGDRVEFVDPVAYDAWCAANGGSALLSAPADAAAIAQQVIADPNFETTAPVAARVGGLDALSMDVTLAPGGRACGVGMIDISRWIHALWEPGWRLRLYLVDLPEGMSVQTLAITVVAPEERFEEVAVETAPIIDSIEFHAP